MKLLKKYPNRRIYDTSSSSYTTIQGIKEMVLNYEAFQVVDSKTGADLTRSILLQIITELEQEGQESLLTNKVLTEIIRFYGNSMSGALRPHIEQALCGLLNQQDKIREVLKKTMNQSGPLPLFAELGKQYTSFWNEILTPAERNKKDS